MYAVERLSRYITRGVYSVSGPFHPFGGAVDIIVVQQQDGSFKSSPWYVRFGKFQGVLKTKEKVVNICVNGTEAGFHMYLDHKGEAFFLSDPDTKEGDFFMSPPSSGDEKDGQMQNDQFKKTLSCDFDGSRTDAVAQIDGGNGKIVARTNSRRSRILGLVFGRRSMKEDNKDGNVQRISSLERAEFAADLLEVKWSTNLPTNDQRADNVTEKRSEGDCRNDGFNINDMVASHGETMDDSLGISIASREHFEEVDGHNSPCLRAHEEILEIYTLESADSVDRNEVISDSDLATLKTDKSDVKSEDFIHKNPSLDIQSSDLAEVPHDMEQTSTERDGGLTTGVSPVESGGKGVSSFIYCETLGSSSIRFDVSTDQVLEALKLSSGGGEEVEVHAEVLYETNEVISEVKPKPESCEENLGTFGHQNIDISRVGDSSVIQNPQADCASNGAFDNVTENSFVTDSPMAADEHVLSGPHSSFDVHLLGSQSIETEVGEVIHQDTLVEELAQEKETYTKPIDILENQSQIKEGESTGPNSYIPIFEFDEALCSTEEVESQSRCTFPHSCNPRDQIEVENTGEGKKVDEVVLSDVVNIIKESGATLPLVDAVNNSIPLSESLEDDRFLLKNTGSCVEKELHPELSLDASGVEIKDHPLVTPEGDAEHKLKDIYQEPSLEGFPQESMSRTSPMRIPRSRTHLGESELMLRSLPNVRSHIHDLETSNILHPLSCSLDLNSENYIRGVINKEGPVSSKLEADSESNLVEDQSTSETAATAVNIENRGEHGDIPIIPAVEISLCRHLLFEGMGVDAACQAFDAEKVDLERFTSLGPSLVKNDRLVVRIGGRYFPWDAAAPVILGMTSFGQKQIFEPESMIAVEQPGKDLNGDPSRAIVPSEGSWRIWPFSFKKSKTMSTVRSVPDGTNEPVVNTISESTRNLTGDNNIQKERIMKKKVRSITPTSEQIASLNLKEGQNVVTFTFSTPMLGRQQVDARIYLCKWNTRIVVSDVDGTITKSDVLGQFMPLVGKDWSHSGVTHLFSAIKENGYQLLFLSARAISQAYLTRQFLFNLKQDGKTLPDGPVLISPDGLFPSLYREVIRRAPHEFKISCLEDIKALFPPDCNPFYAGFGNRDTDEISYLRVGIPKGKIFIINPKGEVAVNHRVDTKSYTSLHALVNGMFPARSSAEQVYDSFSPEHCILLRMNNLGSQIFCTPELYE